jgi:uncharacterized membrane protein
MIVMALDHTREFFHFSAMHFQPEDLTRTTTAIFLTRWITHFCAPIFMFTAGLGAYFWLGRGRTRPQLSAFLAKRGLWLIVLELTAMHLALFLSLTSGMTMLTILWALGACMIFLALLIYLPVRVLAVVSVLMIALHNLADGIRPKQFGGAAWLWNILHQPGVFTIGSEPVVLAYPLVPWIGVMALGFCFGSVMELDAPRRERRMLKLGAAMTAAFLVIRYINVYGDPNPWDGHTFLSFLRCTKYPPSLEFLLMTLGPGLLMLAWLDRRQFAKTNPLIVFGRVPLFYFVLHLFLIHALEFPLALARYGTAAFLLKPLPSMGGVAKFYPADFGYPLWAVYGIWITVVVIMYPLCLWFAGVKERRRDWWLSYL